MNADQKIKELLTKVNQQRLEVNKLEKQAKSKWETNGSINADDKMSPVNIQTASIATIHKLLVTLITQKNASKEAEQLLDIEVNPVYSGFTFDQWLSDFRKRIAIVSINEKRKKLDEQEDRIKNLISPELRRDMELAALEEEIEKQSKE